MIPAFFRILSLSDVVVNRPFRRCIPVYLVGVRSSRRRERNHSPSHTDDAPVDADVVESKICDLTVEYKPDIMIPRSTVATSPGGIRNVKRLLFGTT